MEYSGSIASGGFAFAGRKEMRTMSRLSTTTTNKSRLLPLVTPGEILLEEFLKPMGLSQNALARAVHVPPRRINEIVLGQRAVTADTDLRLARYFGMSEGFFLGLQTDYELRAKKREIGTTLASIRPMAA
jgi:addiction module HigA family antidote